MLRFWIAVAVVAGVGCAFDPAVENIDGDEEIGPDAGAADEDPSVLEGMEAHSVSPPTGVVCTDADADGFTIVPECGGVMDCDDGDSRTHPLQSNWFSLGSPAGSFDYNCDGAEVKRYEDRYIDALYYCKDGWASSNIPACGEQATWTNCSNSFQNDGQCVCSDTTQMQLCR